MRGALIRAAFFLAFAIIVVAADRPPDISRESEAAYHKYVDRSVVVRGRFSFHGKFGPFIDTGKVQVYLKPDPDTAPDLDAESEGKAMVVVGTLRYQLTKPSYFYLGGDCAFLKPGVI